MEKIEPPQTALTFLPKPQVNNFGTTNKKNIYVNLYSISLTGDIKLYQYPYKIDPTVAVEDQLIRDKIFKIGLRKLKDIYGECFQTGDVIYGMKKITELRSVIVNIYRSGEKKEYTLSLQPCSQEVVVNTTKDVKESQITKQAIELMLRDILHHNPNLDFYRGLMVNKNDKKTIGTDALKVNFYPGFTTSFMKTSIGTFLNVTLKNKILSTQTVLQLMNEMKFDSPRNKEILKHTLQERSFKTNYSNRNYIIEDITFDKNPQNTTVNSNGRTINLINYYQEAHQITIKNKNQPLIIVTRKGPQETEEKLYFIPELCYICGIDDAAKKNGKFMKSLAEYTKLQPNDRVTKTNQFLDLFNCTQHKQITAEGKTAITLPSSAEKTAQYGFKITPAEANQFTGSYLNPTALSVNLKNKVFKVGKAVNFDKWICVYQKKNYNDAATLLDTFVKAAKGYGIKVTEPAWCEMQSTRAEDWIAELETFELDKYQFVLFLVDKFDFIYPKLKEDSLVKKGYISQVVKTFSLRKNAMSVCSKIILQINAKLGGYSYDIRFDKNVTDKKLMLVGVDSSHIQGKRTGVAMCATINKTFNQFYNKEPIILEKNKEQLDFCVSTFLDEAVQCYFKKNKELPGGIIIYRQGVSYEQKYFLDNEITKIKNYCNGEDQKGLLKGKPIPYYYILVNTKTTFKFFETSQGRYKNPEPGLLVYEGVTNPDFFEFFIQPQDVTGGSATPTCYHVAHGNMNCPEIIPKLTFDLCSLYSNWQGPVRVPHVLKNAEKHSKMTAKTTKGELNAKLREGQAYL